MEATAVKRPALVWMLVVFFSFMLIASAVAGVAYFANEASTAANRRQDLCVNAHHLYDTLDAVIVESYKPQPPPAVILALFPSLAPYYTPGSPEYEQNQRDARANRDRVLAKLGPRPTC